MGMNYLERQAVRFLLKTKLSDLHLEGLEEFFHELMCLRYPDFLDVRTAGNLGDQGSDGLLLHERKIYACYGPEIIKSPEIRAKFNSDLRKAREKRNGQFDTFVFVHNDQRGIHPVVSECLALAKRRHADISFEQFGYKAFRNEACRLEREEAEDLLKSELPVEEMTYGIELDELQPLLEHLREQRAPTVTDAEIGAVSAKKLDYNEFSDEAKQELRLVMARSSDIDAYYASRVDVTERDEVASGFHEEFLRVRSEIEDPDTIIWKLEIYILGNASAPPRVRRAAQAVVAYFFQACDIFDNPPPGWTPHVADMGSLA